MRTSAAERMASIAVNEAARRAGPRADSITVTADSATAASSASGENASRSSTSAGLAPHQSAIQDEMSPWAPQSTTAVPA